MLDLCEKAAYLNMTDKIFQETGPFWRPLIPDAQQGGGARTAPESVPFIITLI